MKSLLLVCLSFMVTAVVMMGTGRAMDVPVNNNTDSLLIVKEATPHGFNEIFYPRHSKGIFKTSEEKGGDLTVCIGAGRCGQLRVGMGDGENREINVGYEKK